MLFFGYRLLIELSAMFVQPCALPEAFRKSSLFSLSNRTIQMALAFSIRVVITVVLRSNWESKLEQEPQPCWCGEPSPPK